MSEPQEHDEGRLNAEEEAIVLQFAKRTFAPLVILCLVIFSGVSSWYLYYRLEFNLIGKKEVTESFFKFDPDAKELLPSKEYPVIDCEHYGRGCLGGMTYNTHGVIVYFVRFKTEQDARLAAVKYDAYYRKNWLFDGFIEESKLIPFMTDFIHAERPRQYASKK